MNSKDLLTIESQQSEYTFKTGLPRHKELGRIGMQHPWRGKTQPKTVVSSCRAFSLSLLQYDRGSMQIYFYHQLDLDGFRISNQIPSQRFTGNSKAAPIPSCPLNIPRVSSSLLQSGCSYLTSWLPPGERINQRIEKECFNTRSHGRARFSCLHILDAYVVL